MIATRGSFACARPTLRLISAHVKTVYSVDGRFLVGLVEHRMQVQFREPGVRAGPRLDAQLTLVCLAS